MVTLRRDIAAASKNRIFDKARESALTDYDIFMEQKRKNEERLKYRDDGRAQAYAMPFINKEDCFDTENVNYNYFGNPAVKERYAESPIERDEYKEYLKAQLNRTTPEKLLTKEEFYAQKFESERKAKPAKAKERSERFKETRKKLSKNGKIFITVYVLAVAIIASIILVVNRNVKPVTADASEIQDNGGKISALVVEEQDSETNWFDRILDSISNG